MKRNNRILFLYTLITVLGGLITGLHLAGISGAVSFIQDHYRMNEWILGFIVSILAVGAIGGVLCGRYLTGLAGKRKMIFVSALLFAASSIGCAVSDGLVGFALSRLAAGLGMGMISVVMPVYILDVSSVRLRDTFLFYHQLTVALGILIAYIVNYIFFNSSEYWRWIFAFPFGFSIIYILLVSILPGNNHRATALTYSVPLKPEKNELQPRLLVVLMTGIWLQLTGFYIIISYVPSIFELSGVHEDISLLQSVYAGAVYLVCTFFAIWIINSIGYKTLLMAGSLLMSLSLLYLMYVFSASATDTIECLVAVLCYTGSLGLLQVINIPLMRESHFMLIMVSALICSSLALQFFPWIVNHGEVVFLFALLGIISLLFTLYILFFYPFTAKHAEPELCIETSKHINT